MMHRNFINFVDRYTQGLSSTSEDSLSSAGQFPNKTVTARHATVPYVFLIFTLMFISLQPVSKCFAKDIDYQSLQEDPITNAYKKLRSKGRIDIIVKQTTKETPRTSRQKTAKAKKQNPKTAQTEKSARQILQDNLYPASTNTTSQDTISPDISRPDSGISEDIAVQTANMIWPVKNGYVSRSVSSRHSGTDMITSEGTPIYAVLDGIVEIVTDGGKNFRGYGNTTIINHDGKLWSLYSHCSALYVRVGQHVKCGDKIAAVGSTGRVTTSHLHFELRDSGGNPLDALKYLPAEGALPQTYVKH